MARDDVDDGQGEDHRGLRRGRPHDDALRYRNVARGYLPLPAETATDLQAQLENINIHVTLDEQESRPTSPTRTPASCTGLFLLGWGADYPDVTNFLDYHFGAGCTAAFGTCYPEIADPLTTGGQTCRSRPTAGRLHRGQQRASPRTSRWSRSPCGLRNAYLADVSRPADLAAEQRAAVQDDAVGVGR